MPIELPMAWIVILNVTLWPLIQLSLAWGFLRLPGAWFDPPRTGFSFETRAFYERWLGIKHWKDRLPDGARWLGGGFAKRDLAAVDPDYLRRFIQETWRGELCHDCAFLFVPVFFLWNPWWGDLVIVAYALAANAPCLLAQRYNRLRLRRLLAKIAAQTAQPRPLAQPPDSHS
jgi:glycosyl-4,4'-diaponeurosporenoate acyltransferase